MTQWKITYNIIKEMVISAPTNDEARWKFNRIDSSADRQVVHIEEIK